jgi:hypothetical protein
MIKIKMKSLGFDVIASDSHYFKDIHSNITLPIVTHRPDCIGYRQNDSNVCIGEAKYVGDLQSTRTKTQLRDFIMLCKDNEKCSLIIATPSGENERLNKILRKNNMVEGKRFIVLLIPEELLPHENS